MYKRFFVALIVILSLPFMVGAEENAPSTKPSLGFDALKSIDNMFDKLDKLTTSILSGDVEESEEETESEDVSEEEAVETLSEDSEVGEIPMNADLAGDKSDATPPDLHPTISSSDFEDYVTPSEDTKPQFEEPESGDNEDTTSKDLSGNVKTIEPVSQVTPKEFLVMCREASSELILNAIENRNADVNAADAYGVTPLIAAAESNQSPEVIEILTDAGADVDARDKDGQTALMYAASANPNPAVISAIALQGAHVNARDNNRRTALMYAAWRNNADVVSALIDAGAEELADNKGWTPLFWAARYTEHPEVIGVLLDAGHDPKAHSYDMAKPIEHANVNPKLMNTEELLRLENESR